MSQERAIKIIAEACGWVAFACVAYGGVWLLGALLGVWP